MRNPAAAVFSLLLGIVFAVPGALLGIWVALRQFRIEWAFDWALWAARHSPHPLTAPPEEIANRAINPPWVIFAAVGAFFLCAMALSSLRSARRSMRAVDESDDGKARLALKTTHPRVGRPLEGTLRLAKDASPGDRFVVELSCKRYGNSDSRMDEAFLEQQDVAAIQGAHGWSVLFRFEIPVTAPASNAGHFLSARKFQWRLYLKPAKGWSVFASRFDLVLGPAPAEELRAVEADATPGERAIIDAFDAISPLMGRGKLLAHEREQLRSLPPEHLAIARKVSAMPLKILKWAFIAFVVLFVAIPTVFSLLVAGVAALQR